MERSLLVRVRVPAREEIMAGVGVEESLLLVVVVTVEVYVPWPRIHCGSSVTISPGVTIVLVARRGRLLGRVMEMSPSES